MGENTYRLELELEGDNSRRVLMTLLDSSKRCQYMTEGCPAVEISINYCINGGRFNGKNCLGKGLFDGASNLGMSPREALKQNCEKDPFEYFEERDPLGDHY